MYKSLVLLCVVFCVVTGKNALIYFSIINLKNWQLISDYLALIRLQNFLYVALFSNTKKSFLN